MSRSVISTAGRMTLALVVGGGLLAACGGGGGEQSIIRSFFQASRFNDRTTLGNMSMVVFDPQEDGIVSGTSVESVTEEQRRPLRLRELASALEEIRAAETTFRAEKKTYQDENLEAIARVIAAEREEEDVAGRDQEVQEAWRTWRDDERDFARNVSAAQNALDGEARIAQASTYDPANPLDVAQFEGELVSKDVTVAATVTKDEVAADRTMVITLEKVELQGGEDGLIDGRWIITALE